MAIFRDHFSAHAALYASARPRYPAALFDWLATLGPARDTAWDCGTGSGQAALELARHYRRVLATDASPEQIANAIAHPRIEYRVARAEDSGQAPAGVDAITVAQALHWFDLKAFYAEARRVLRPGGALVAWCYTQPTVDPACDALTEEFYRNIVGPYWPEERKYVEEGYRSFDFPLREAAAPAFEMCEIWTPAQFLAYLRSWSATRRYLAARGTDPVEPLAKKLEPLWKKGSRPVRWPVHVRAGIKSA